ncbi:PREDICTED: uncharacterized protein LOC108359172 [Rhagoletis zephyria]|uniref:uncharacterized protein LOC108359172 n=1 Tax=Rhagoletis zephyria TaxID=28612 RepID=UPI0008114E5B|nr:PREDICTED: uncharacterized protein LOC108359172 [Rhagoletis zephyria]
MDAKRVTAPTGYSTVQAVQSRHKKKQVVPNKQVQDGAQPMPAVLSIPLPPFLPRLQSDDTRRAVRIRKSSPLLHQLSGDIAQNRRLRLRRQLSPMWKGPPYLATPLHVTTTGTSSS